VSEFLLELVSNPQFAGQSILDDVLLQSNQIISLLVKRSSLGDLPFVHNWVKSKHRDEVREMVKREHGWQFNALHASAVQVDEFRLEEMVGNMEQLAPWIWDLLESGKTGGRKQ
jgi:hypothetical protein